jgi:hypothetical protein
MRAVLIVCGLLTGCQWVPGTEAYKIAEGQKLVAAGLRDPSSAQFRNSFFRPVGSVVCGEFNGKNAYGAYVGFKRFYVMDGEAKTEPDTRPLTTSDDIVIDKLQRAMFQYDIWCKQS